MQKRAWGRLFFAEATGLSLAGAVAQAIALLFSPAVLQRYDAQAFGIASFLLGIAGSVGQLCCLRYDLALVAQTDEEVVEQLAWAAIATVAAASLLCLVIAGIWTALGIHALLLACTVGAVGLHTVGAARVLRQHGPLLIGRAAMLRALLQSIVQLLAASWQDQTAALLFAYLLSYLGAALLFFPVLFAHARVSPHQVWHTAWESREYPLLLLPGALIFDGSLWLHQTILLRYDPASLGCYAVIHRLLAAPMAVVTAAVGQLFLRWMSRLPICERKYLYRNISLGMLLLGGGAALLLYPLAGWIPRFFGDHWGEAVWMLRVLLPFFVVRFAIAPVTSGLIATKHRRALVLWQVAMLVLTLLAVWISSIWGLSLLGYLAWHGGLLSIGYLLLWVWGGQRIAQQGEPV